MTIEEVVRKYKAAISLNEPMSSRQILEFEKVLGVALPLEYREYLQCGNGGSAFGLLLQSTSESELWNDCLLSFHNWGNGDFDCIRIGGAQHGPIVFANHNPDTVVEVAPNLTAWFAAIAQEYDIHSDIFHPRDYKRSSRAAGVYREVLPALAGVDCELNSTS